MLIVVVCILFTACGGGGGGGEAADGGGNDVGSPGPPPADGDYVAIGDSITAGSQDDIAGDGIGFEPILEDLLVSAGYTSTVAEEGVSGDTSSDGLGGLPGILTAYPDADYYLVLYGTNDAMTPVPSGFGLSPGDPGYAGTFKDNMQRMIDLIEADGKIPYLAKVPYATGGFSGLNNDIQEYNNVVDELVFENGIVVAPPDFYCLFETFPARLSSDGLHPDGTGYQSMAQYWFNALTDQPNQECN